MAHTKDTHLFRQQIPAGVLAYRAPRDGDAHVKTPEPEPLLKGFFLFLKNNTKNNWLTQSWTAHSWESQAELKWPCLQLVAGYHSMYKHTQKSNTNVQIIKCYFYTPSTNHNCTEAHYSLISDFKEFQVISSCPSLVRTRSYPRPQWCTREAKVMG